MVKRQRISNEMEKERQRTMGKHHPHGKCRKRMNGCTNEWINENEENREKNTRMTHKAEKANEHLPKCEIRQFICDQSSKERFS